MRILGIETSCDETAISVVENGQILVSNVIGSQIEIHARYGGIVPEVASRQHILSIIPIYRQALAQASVSPTSLDAIAVTVGPGLAGSLLIGVNFAKGLSLSLDRPFIGVNHLEGHVYAAWLEEGQNPEQNPGFPLICLIASGGHTDLIFMAGHGHYELLGQTLDDAAGEAFDKGARLLGLGFPGGPEIQRVAQGSNTPEPLPRAWLGGSLNFSFSGLKTALLHRTQALGLMESSINPELDVEEQNYRRSALASGLQEAIIDVLVEKTLKAALHYGAKGILLGGGVAANSLLRKEMSGRSSLPVLVPRPELCTDNGAMVAAAGYFTTLERGFPPEHSLSADIIPSLRLGLV